MADCIRMQLGSNLHWDQTCKYAIQTCNFAKTAPNFHWLRLAKHAAPVSRGTRVQTP